MTVKEIIAALRCTVGLTATEGCIGCRYAWAHTHVGCDKDKICVNAISVLERMVWIPATERLPKPGKRVLATDGRYVGEAYLTETGTWWRSYGAPWRTMMERSVTHWMELPDGVWDYDEDEDEEEEEEEEEELTERDAELMKRRGRALRWDELRNGMTVIYDRSTGNKMWLEKVTIDKIEHSPDILTAALDGEQGKMVRIPRTHADDGRVRQCREEQGSV